MKRAQYNAAVVGCGRSGSLFDSDQKRNSISSHCGAYKNHEKINLVALCDQDNEKLMESSKIWGVENIYTDNTELLKDQSIDILSICTLPESHLKIAESAASNGVKAIFCEKPIAHNVDEALKIINICKEKGTYLFINHQRRWSNTFKDLKMRIDKREFGEIQRVNFLYSRGIYNSGSHLFDLLRMLFGEISEVRSLDSLIDFEDEPTITAHLSFLDGFPGLIIGVNGDRYRLFNLEVFFTKGKLTLDSSLNCSFQRSIGSSRSNEFKELSSPIEVDLQRESQPLLLNALDEITSLIEGSETNISCSGFDGLKSLEIIKGLETSLNQKESVSF